MARRPAYATAAALLVLAAALLVMRGAGRAPTPVHNAFGAGPTVVLVHGLGSTPAHWLPAARLLARRFRVVLVELPGHGASAMPEPFSLADVTRALDAAIAAETDDPVVVVGHSVGGLVAAAHALERPERVRGLVLVETALRPQADAAARAAALQALDQDYRDFVRTAWAAFGRDSAQGALLAREVLAHDSTHIERWIRLALTVDLSARAASLRVPVLALVAPHTWPHDEPWSVTAAALGYSGVPTLAVERIEPSGHFVPLDRPAEVARAIARFAGPPADGVPATGTPAPLPRLAAR